MNEKNPITLKKEDVITLAVTDLNNLGCGVGRAEGDGRVVFVKGAVSGDFVRAKIIKVNQSFCVARLLEILTPSPIRMESAFCDAPEACGGCVYRHVTYEHELSLKREYVEVAFRKAGLGDVTVLPTLSTGKITHYRNKGQYPVTRTKDGIRAGFFASKSHHIIPSEHCAIQSERFAPIVAWICSFAEAHGWSVYDEESGRGLLRHIYLRVGEKTGQVMVCLVINGETLPDAEGFVCALTEQFPEVVSVLLNHNRANTNVVLGKKFTVLRGSASIEDELCGVRFSVSADSFYQVNRDGAELLYTKAAELADLKGGELLCDLYCGAGTIGLSILSLSKTSTFSLVGASKNVARLIGVELVGAAVECAKENARRNGIENAEFYCGDASSKEMILSCTGGKTPDVVVIDPPRKGSTKELVECLSELGVRKIVYVSCNPDTLARDCAWFAEMGYAIGEVVPVDMFPRTGHVESVVCLTRPDKST